MTTLSPPLTHIRFDEQGRPWLEGTNIKVMEVVLHHLSEHADASRIHENPDGHIPLGHIHAAPACYYDNKAAFDERIQLDRERYERRRSEALDSPFRKRMRDAGKLP